MSYPIRAGLVLLGLLSAGAARAECSVSADQGVSARPVNPTNQADANLIISMTFIPKLTHLDYRTAAERPACDLGPLTPGDAAYELWGSDASGRQRKALPAKKGQPIALVIPIADMLKLTESAKTGKPAPTEGYLLATITNDALMGWQFYTGMPDPTVLKHDMSEALAGRGAPIFRNSADHKTEIFMPHN